MQQGDYTSLSSSYYQYSQNPNPSLNPSPLPTDHHHPASPFASNYASAPPFANNYPPSDNYTPYPSTYPLHPQNPDPVPSISPTAPSFSPNPNLQPSFNPPPPSQPSSFPQFESHAPYHQQSYYPPYDQHQSAPSYPAPSSIPSNPNFNFNSPYTYDRSAKFNESGYGRSGSDLGSGRYSSGGYGGGDGYGDGVYAYQGSKAEPYGARGTGSKSSTWFSSSSLFDDFGRPISFPSGKNQTVSSTKIARAVPKADSQQDTKGGVQKYRVKLLPESGGQSTMDVLCQIGLDGIRMLDPSTSRTLRIYPLDTVTRCDVTDSSTFAFWSKSYVDIEPRRIRLQSNSYTTNTILDTVTAATVQLKEMGGRNGPSDSFKVSDQPTEKKRGLGDWMNMMKPVNEEKDHWVPDEAVTKCTSCGTDFSAFVRKHHCRNCGDIFCDKCTHGRIALTTDENAPQVRVCDRCMAEVTHRSSNTKEVDSRSAALKSHEDLAKKLQDIDVCYAFVEFKDIAGVQNAIKIFRALDFIFYGLEIKKHGKQADILVQLDALGLKIIQVTADGNCFFRALADQLEGNEDEHMKIWVFCKAYKQVDPAVHPCMRHLFRTWKGMSSAI